MDKTRLADERALFASAQIAIDALRAENYDGQAAIRRHAETGRFYAEFPGGDWLRSAAISTKQGA